MQPFVIPIRACELSAEADAGEVGLTAGYFYTIAVGYNAS